MARLSSKLVGHRKILDTLSQAARNGKLAPTLLFTGPSGIGKKLVALTLLQRMVCEKMPEGQAEACGECGSCLRVEKGQSESLMLVEPDGASIKIEQTRDVQQFLVLRTMGRARMVIIDQAHLLNPQSANSLLKSLEEPPQKTYFVLLTPIAASLLPTIRSRSQLIRFQALSDEELRKVVGREADDWVFRSSNGSVEAARTLMESREELMEGEEAVANFLKAATERFPGEEISVLRELMKERPALAHITRLVQGALRDSLRFQSGAKVASHERWTEIHAELARIPSPQLLRLSEQALEFEYDLARNVDRGLILENFAIRLKQAARARA